MVSKVGTERCANEDAGLRRERWIVRSHIWLEGERNIVYKSENFSLIDVFKTVMLTAIRNGPKRTISASGGLVLLHLNVFFTVNL